MPKVSGHRWPGRGTIVMGALIVTSFGNEIDAQRAPKRADRFVDSLVARIPGGDTLRLAPTVRDTVVGGGVVMTFRRAGGRVTGALLHAGRVRNIAFTRVAAR